MTPSSCSGGGGKSTVPFRNDNAPLSTWNSGDIEQATAIFEQELPDKNQRLSPPEVATTFPGFEKLPPELQLQIWRATLSEIRHILLHHDWEVTDTLTNDKLFENFWQVECLGFIRVLHVHNFIWTRVSDNRQVKYEDWMCDDPLGELLNRFYDPEVLQQCHQEMNGLFVAVQKRFKYGKIPRVHIQGYSLPKTSKAEENVESGQMGEIEDGTKVALPFPGKILNIIFICVAPQTNGAPLAKMPHPQPVGPGSVGPTDLKKVIENYFTLAQFCYYLPDAELELFPQEYKPTNFSNMPKEIQLEIWRATFPAGKRFMLEKMSELIEFNGSTADPEVARDDTYENPIALRVCRQSRDEALRFFQPLVMSPDSALRFIIYFNP
ncbi:hypothetical protein G7Y89_g6808 [Cudoniella acicularis]|uniref:2EXR domain-containing protein n=1 Tax=Cudoniella acicularis TaxID=354080 RepID=A0A8H4RL91_9HELO|nr:hypothetical protein G7Y89_g6808 [Cudoniella acicularis]